jgi:hypothetical protein
MDLTVESIRSVATQVAEKKHSFSFLLFRWCRRCNCCQIMGIAIVCIVALVEIQFNGAAVERVESFKFLVSKEKTYKYI